MRRVLLLIHHPENARLLAVSLEGYCQVLQPDDPLYLNFPFDLGIVDGPMLDRWGDVVQLRKAVERPVILPFLLVTSRQEVSLSTRRLWEWVDDFLTLPTSKAELRARVELLLRARSLSVQLKVRNDDLEAFVQAMTHDLRAPARVIEGFTRQLREEQAQNLDQQGLHDLARIRMAAVRMQELIDLLVDFSRLGKGSVRLGRVELASIVTGCLNDLEEEIAAHEARVRVEDGLPAVWGDPALLKVAVTNLLGNAIKFVHPGERPQVTVFGSTEQGVGRLTIRDNGIGIPPEHHERIFTPFVRLHGEEAFSGSGLGLPAARKVVELMGGRLRLRSFPNDGSSFWIELPAAE